MTLADAELVVAALLGFLALRGYFKAQVAYEPVSLEGPGLMLALAIVLIVLSVWTMSN